MTQRIPPLKQLHAFEAAARHESFTKAADELHVTQAAVSHQVRALEEHLGQKLFHRKTRQLVLTESARVFAERLGRAFADIAAAADDIAERPMTGTLRLSVAPFFANRMLLPVLHRFHERFPEIKIEPQMNAQVVDLNGPDLDGAIRYGDGNWPGLGAMLLWKDQVCPVAAPSFVDGRALPMDPRDIAALPLAYNLGTQEDWTNWFRRVGVSEDVEPVMIGYPDRARAIDLALSGNGVSIADITLTRNDVRTGHLVRLHPETVPSRKNMYVVFADTAHPDPRLMAFVEWFKQEHAGSGGDPD